MMRSTQTTAAATPCVSPRHSSDVLGASSRGLESIRVSLAEPTPIHLNPPTPQQKIERLTNHVGPQAEGTIRNAFLKRDSARKLQQTWDMPPVAHIPKSRAGADSHSREISDFSSPRIIPQKDEASASWSGIPLDTGKRSGSKGEEITPPFVSKIQGIWHNCVKTFTTNPFRKSKEAQARSSEEGGKVHSYSKIEKENKNIKSKSQSAIPKKLIDEGNIRTSKKVEVAQECVAGNSWWDVAVASERVGTRNSNSENGNTILDDEISINESFQEAKAYGFKEAKRDREFQLKNPVCLEEKTVKGGKTPNSTHVRVLEVTKDDAKLEKLQQSETLGFAIRSLSRAIPRADFEGARNLMQENSSSDATKETTDHVSIHKPISQKTRMLEQESPTTQVQGHLTNTLATEPKNSEENTTNVSLRPQPGYVNTTDVGSGADGQCWVHRWLASYSAQDVLLETGSSQLAVSRPALTN